MAIGELGLFMPERRIVQLADGASDETLDALEPETEAVITAAIAAAESEIDGLIKGRYAVPVSPVPAELKRIAGQNAIRNLFLRKSEFSQAWEKVYDANLDRLEKIELGDGQMGGTAAAAADTVTGEGAGLVFGGGGLDGF